MAANQQLIDYVRQQLGAGYSADQLRQVLVRQGWAEADVDEAIRHVQQPPQAVKTGPSEKPVEGKKAPGEQPGTGKKKSSRKLIIAILVIVLVAAVGGILLLIAFGFPLGIFDFTGGDDRMATGFTNLGKPIDWDYSGTDFNLVITNGMGKTLTLTAATADGCDPLEFDEDFPPGAMKNLRFSSCEDVAPGSSYHVNVEVRYVESVYELAETGSVTGTAL